MGIESAPLVCMDNSDTKSSNEADAKRADNAANSDTHASAVDGRKHLARDNASYDPPTYLRDKIEDTDNL